MGLGENQQHSITPVLHYSNEYQDDQADDIDRPDGRNGRRKGAMRRCEYTGEQRTRGGEEAGEIETEALCRGADHGRK